MSVPQTFSTVTQPFTMAGLTSESMLLAAQAMTSPSICHIEHPTMYTTLPYHHTL